MLNLEGRVAVVFGVANKRSIAWAIVQKLHEAGAQLAIGYQNERLKSEADGLIAELPGAEAFQCDVSNDAEIEQVFARLKERYGADILVEAHLAIGDEVEAGAALIADQRRNRVAVLFAIGGVAIERGQRLLLGAQVIRGALLDAVGLREAQPVGVVGVEPQRVREMCWPSVISVSPIARRNFFDVQKTSLPFRYETYTERASCTWKTRAFARSNAA